MFDRNTKNKKKRDKPFFIPFTPPSFSRLYAYVFSGGDARATSPIANGIRQVTLENFSKNIYRECRISSSRVYK